MTWTKTHTWAAVAVGAVLVLVAVLLWQPWRSDSVAAHDDPEVIPPIVASDDMVIDVDSGPVTVLTLHADTTVYDEPGGAATHELARWTYYSHEQTLLVRETQEIDGTTWFYVDLPLKPHGQRGWVAPEDSSQAQVSTHAEINLGTRTVTVWDGETEVGSYPVAIGTDETPTPLGTFYVTDPLDLTANPTGVYGAFAIGISGYSEVLDEFYGAPPQIALHGTNQPDLIGDAVSNGCIRLANEDILEVAQVLNLGSPVSIVAS